VFPVHAWCTLRAREHERWRPAGGRPPARLRVGRVSIFVHHGSQWAYYRDGGRPLRRRIGNDRDAAVRVAAEINARLAAGAPSPLSFSPISIQELRRAYLEHHERVLASSLATVRRYAAATAHLERFAAGLPRPVAAHELPAEHFAAYLRAAEVSPNGHPHSAKRRLLDKGVLFVLEVCRALFAFAVRRRHLPPLPDNPFATLRALSPDAFPLHFLLAKSGLRVGEATHLLIEDVDLEGGWLHVRNKPCLGWRVKTGAGRQVPLAPQLVEVLQRSIGSRIAGPVFLRPRFIGGESPPLTCGLAGLEHVCRERQAAAGAATRPEALWIARRVWRDAGALKTNVSTFLLRSVSSKAPERPAKPDPMTTTS
jgi:integrase